MVTTLGYVSECGCQRCDKPSAVFVTGHDRLIFDTLCLEHITSTPITCTKLSCGNVAQFYFAVETRAGSLFGPEVKRGFLCPQHFTREFIFSAEGGSVPPFKANLEHFDRLERQFKKAGKPPLAVFCTCPDWIGSFPQIVAAQVEYTRHTGVEYTGSRFRVCPWCGLRLTKLYGAKPITALYAEKRKDEQ